MLRDSSVIVLLELPLSHGEELEHIKSFRDAVLDTDHAANKKIKIVK